jgi:hypothetical protein
MSILYSSAFSWKSRILVEAGRKAGPTRVELWDPSQA